MFRARRLTVRDCTASLPDSDGIRDRKIHRVRMASAAVVRHAGTSACWSATGSTWG